jgi:tetratricopeptide (TPR) repeat protein
MFQRSRKSADEIVRSAAPTGSARGSRRKRRWAAVATTVVLAAYILAAYFLLGPQPAWIQRMLAAGCVALAMAAFLLFTRQKESPEEVLFRARLAQRSDFGKQLRTWKDQQRTIKLPWLGETSLRLLGGIVVFGVVAAWWLTPSLAPVRVKEHAADDLTVSLGEEIACVVLIAPGGNSAVVQPPLAPAIARQMAKLIEDDANAYQRGLKAMAEGRHDDARAALSAALGEDKPDAAQVNLARAQNEMYAGLFRDAAQYYASALQQQPDNPMLLIQAAVAWLQAGSLENAEPLVARAIKACGEKSGDAERARAYALHVQAVVLAGRGRQFDEAETTCRKARELFEKLAGTSHPFLAASLHNQAVLYLVQAKYPGAANLFEEAQTHWGRTLGQQSFPVATNLATQAVLQTALGAYARADELLDRAEAITREQLTEDHPLNAPRLIARAALYDAKGQYAEAQKTANEALAAIEKAWGPGHPCNAPALDVAARACLDGGRYYRAETLSQRAVVLNKKVWGPQHPFYAHALCRRAELRLLRKEFTEAEALCRQALDIYQRSFGKGHPGAADVLNDWGQLEIARQRSRDARSHLDEALKIREVAFGKEHPAVACTLGYLAALDNSPRTYNHGKPIYKRAIDMDENLLGRQHPDVARLLRGQAELFAADEEFSDATAAFDRALEIQEKSLPPWHPELAVTLEAYAAMLRAQNPPDADHAAVLESRAQKVRRQHDQQDRPE